MLKALKEQNRIVSKSGSNELYTGDLRKDIEKLSKRPEAAKLGAVLKVIYDELTRITNTYGQLEDLSDPETKGFINTTVKELDRIYDKLEDI